MAFDANDILTLCKAGFTAQQIAGLSALAAKPEPAPAPAPEPVPAPAPVEPPKEDPVLLELQKLTGLMQSGALAQTQQPEPLTPEQILAEIINPPARKE